MNLLMLLMVVEALLGCIEKALDCANRVMSNGENFILYCYC